MKYLILFIIGLIEAFGTSINSKFRQRSNRLWAFITAFVNIFIWAYIIDSIIKNIDNFWMIAVYGLSYATGDVIGLTFDSYLEKIAKFRGVKTKKRKLLKRKK